MSSAVQSMMALLPGICIYDLLWCCCPQAPNQSDLDYGHMPSDNLIEQDQSKVSSEVFQVTPAKIMQHLGHTGCWLWYCVFVYVISTEYFLHFALWSNWRCAARRPANITHRWRQKLGQSVAASEVKHHTYSCYTLFFKKACMHIRIVVR